MAQFEVYENMNPATRNSIPYLLDVQADLLDALTTRVVVPLVLADEAGGTAQHFCPLFKNKRYRCCHVHR